ncbi:MAG: aminotransferase class III-fold pyridoxal phosphate-dependent enzyme [Phycisphaeraceae bacterium]|nr:aminotransferase class III-fold pyridoxal phosphate-dependent enzyme [Phycisphaeraceae bacterium]
MATTADIIARHDKHMVINLARWPVAIVRGQGVKLFDAEGKEYLDLFAGFGAGILGHCHPDLARAVCEQAHQLWHVGNLMHTEPQTHAAEAIARLGFGGKSFFCHTGADANEAAIKLTRLYGKAHPGKGGPIPGTSLKGRYKVISATRSFHGRGMATMAATGQPAVREGFEPLPAGYLNVEYNSLDAIKAALDEQTVAVIVEPIQGEGGICVPDDHYLPSLRKLCDEHDLLLIFDEVWTGCGRTGKYFGHQHWPVTPDIMTLGKGVGGGLALGVMCATERVADLYNVKKNGGVVKHATTLGGNCLATAAAAMIFHVLERDKLPEHAAKLGLHAINRLRTFATSHSVVKDVRGKGLFIGIELDPTAPGCWFKDGSEVVTRCREKGLMVNVSQKTVIRLAPPLIIAQDELDRGLTIFEEVLTKG